MCMLHGNLIELIGRIIHGECETAVKCYWIDVGWPENSGTEYALPPFFGFVSIIMGLGLVEWLIFT